MKTNTVCGHRWVSYLLALAMIALPMIFPVASHAQTTDLVIGNYVKLSEKRITRTVYEYSYQADVTNSGPGVLNVAGTVISNSPYTTIVDDSLSFGDVPASATVTSSDTFTFRHDRSYAFSWSNLAWNISSVPQQPAITVDEKNRVVSVITPEGGTISTQGADGTRFTLTFPPGALLTPEEISITPVASINGLPLSNGIIAGVQMAPAGLRLPNPATLEIELPSTGEMDELVGFLIQDTGEGFHLYPILINGNSVSLKLFHFTIGGVASGSCIDVNALNNATGLTPEELAQNRMAILYRNFLGCLSDYSDEEYLQAIRDIHYDWFYGAAGISVLISQAKSDPENFLERAISQFNAWQFSLLYNPFKTDWSIGEPQLYQFPMPLDCGHPSGENCIDLGDVAEAAAAAIFEAFQKAVTLANQTCIDGGQNQDSNALEWIAMADSLTFSGYYPYYEESGVWDINDLLQSKTCGIYTIEFEPASVCLFIGQSDVIRVVGKDILGNSIVLGDPPAPFRTINFERQSNSAAVGVDRLANDVIEVTGSQTGSSRIEFGIVLSGGTVAYQTTANIAVEQMIVTVTPDQVTILADNTEQLTATIKDCYGNPYTGCALEWYSNNIGVAQVTDSGLVTAGSPGVATITAVCSDAIGVARILVIEPTTFRIIPSSTVLILGNNTKTLRCELTDGSGNLVDILPPATVTWTSDSSGVSLSSTTGPEVDVTPNDEGPATITATYTDPYGQKTATAIVRVRSFQGVWDTYWYGVGIGGETRYFYTPMGITVDGTNAIGTYHYNTLIWGRVNGQLSGSVSLNGYEFSGNWVESCAVDCNRLPWSGAFSFHLAPNGNSFTGLWNGLNDWYGNRR